MFIVSFRQTYATYTHEIPQIQVLHLVGRSKPGDNASEEAEKKALEEHKEHCDILQVIMFFSFII